MPVAEHERLLLKLTRLLRLVAHAEEIGRSDDELPHLTVPLIGLDDVIGLIRMEPVGESPYDAHHLRVLSVVAAQLGAYLTMIKLREDESRKTRELAAAHEFQQRLMGVVSHDLRNPLSVITTVASSLLQKTDDPPKARALERALRSAQRANRIINDLLDVTHVRVTGEMRVSRKRIELVALINDVLGDIRIANPGREIRFAGPSEDSIFGEWDPDRLVQVTSNLVNNALQHGDEHAPIEVTLRAEHDDVVLSVHNQGPQIPDEL
ncbi:MAG: sensor histidine kinase, partial [Myxococcaceae bacterium]